MPSRETVQRRAHLLARFAAGQLGVQLLMVLGGLLLIRWMDVDAFAQYSVAFGFAATLRMLVDLGLAGSIVALVGERLDDRRLLGEYVVAARRQRRRNFLVVAPLGAVAFMVVSGGHGWPIATRIALAATIVAGLYVQGWLAISTGPLSAHREFTALYRPQTLGAAARLAAIVAAQVGGLLTSVVAQTVQVLTTAVSGRALQRSADRLVTGPSTGADERLAEMRRYLRPLWPGLVFAAVQGQVLILAASAFASERAIAEVGALTRLTQLLTFFVAMNAIVVAPAIARTPSGRLLSRYLSIAGIALLAAAGISLAAFLWPAPFLLLLGSTYEDLAGTTVGLAIAGGCLTYLDSLIWSMNSARRWVYAWHTAFYIAFVLVNQLAGVLLLDLTTTDGLLAFGVWTSGAVLAAQLVGTLYGFRRGAPTLNATPPGS